MRGVVDRSDVRVRSCRRADQGADDEGGEQEHRSEDGQSDRRGPPVGEPSPQLDEHRHGRDEPQGAEQRRASCAGDQSGAHERSDVVKDMRGQPDDTADGSCEDGPCRAAPWGQMGVVVPLVSERGVQGRGCRRVVSSHIRMVVAGSCLTA